MTPGAHLDGCAPGAHDGCMTRTGTPALPDLAATAAQIPAGLPALDLHAAIAAITADVARCMDAESAADTAATGHAALTGMRRGTEVEYTRAGITRRGRYAGSAAARRWARGTRRPAWVGITAVTNTTTEGAEWIPAAEITGIRVAPPAALPECATFTGTGARCESCRIRRAIHA